MDIQLRCKDCSKELTVRERYRGLSVPCPSCGASISIPKADEAPPAPNKPAVPAAAPTPPVAAKPPAAPVPGGDFDTEAIPDVDELDDLADTDDIEATDAPDAPVGDVGSDTVAGKAARIAKSSKPIATEARRSFRNPIMEAKVEDESSLTLADRLERLRDKQRSKRNMQYVLGSVVIAICMYLNFYVTLPIIFGDPQLLTVLGDGMAKIGDLDGAIANYRKAIRVRKTYYFAYLRLGQALMARKDWDNAEAALKPLLEQEDPELLSSAHEELARICQARHVAGGGNELLEQAMTHIEQALLQNPLNDEAKKLRTEVFYDYYVPTRARTAFDHVAQTEILEAQRRSAAAFENAKPNQGTVEMADGTVQEGFFWKFETCDEPEHYIRVVPPKQRVKGFLDVQVTEWKTPPRATAEDIRDDRDNRDAYLPQTSRTETFEFEWRDGLWVKSYDPFNPIPERRDDPEETPEEPDDDQGALRR